VAFVSGLELSNNTDLLSVELLLDFLTGTSGVGREQEKAADIVRVVLAGCLVGKLGDDEEKEDNVIEGVKQLDLFCLQLAVQDFIFRSKYK